MHADSATSTTTPEAANAAVDSEALWYKDAVIYQLHVRSYCDSNGDGVGDFPGLTSRLDYIQDLGVTAIWLLPFFPSPLRDDGYDISDYTNVNPVYGNLRDFKTFLRESHRRGLRVITELVLNHTSDQHEWFQRSRKAKPGSRWRDFYVWSDHPDRYRDARVIFQDFETSNWTWDAVAGAYFWHRFYSHQPDLNFENPDVHQAMFKVIDFWLEMGVDGVRLDAVPYLYEREGTNCENLPETHEFLKTFRRHVDERFTGKMFLAEANQWPEDAAAYFGDGDECHMNFQFPLMPRLFLAVEREDRFPIIDILEQTPEIPDNCQWGIFLRNHDELTLEMVTDEERDYMYRSFASDPQARVNLGIRRRLAPLLRNNRRKMELLSGLLLSLPGTPIIYYGDEIRMGDNIYLGDRDSVRTPMQWNSDRNAGFSRANPQKLFLPVIIDPEYHFSLRNVEVEHNSPHSLLWWMRRLINLRKQFQAFSRGDFEILTPDNPKVLAFVREFNGDTLLIVANLSRYSQCAELNLSRYRGQTPTELFGQTRFPPIGELPYFLTLGPYGFYWFQIHWRESESVTLSPSRLPVSRARARWESFLSGRGKATFQRALAPYLQRQRWFAGKARSVQSVELIDTFFLHHRRLRGAQAAGDGQGSARFDDIAAWTRLLLIRVNYAEGEAENYLAPVLLADEETANNILGDHPSAGILRVEPSGGGTCRTFCEATWERDFWLALLEAIAHHRQIKAQHGEFRASHTRAFRRLWSPEVVAQSPTIHGGEQSNTSVVFGERFILKLFRRLSPGTNPDLEIGRVLTEHTSLSHVPDVAAALEYDAADGPSMTAAILHEYLPNEEDAWVYTLDELGRYLERVQSAEWEAETVPMHAPRGARSGRTTETPHEPTVVTPADLELPKQISWVELADQELPSLARQIVGTYLQSAELLGQRTGQLHVALASIQDDRNFAPEPFSKLYQRSLYQSMRTQTRTSLELLRKRRAHLPESVRADADRVIEREASILSHFNELTTRTINTQRIRCHGDYHLGQVLFTGKDFVIIDFEGEPDRPVSERRIKTSPLRDVAGMIRSFHYAAHAALSDQAPGVVIHQESPIGPEVWMHYWYIWTSASFLRGYFCEAARGQFLPEGRSDLDILVRAYLLEKALYELRYELNNRPDWVKIPLQGVLQLLD